MASSVQSPPHSTSLPETIQSRDTQGPPAEEDEGDPADTTAAVLRESLMRVLDYKILRRPPRPRVKVAAGSRKFMEAILPPTTPNVDDPPPSSRDGLFRLKPRSKAKPDGTVRLRYEPPENPSYCLGSSVLRTRLNSREFPLSTLNFVTCNGITHGWKQWVEDFFDRGGEPLRILERVGIKDAIWMTSRLQTRRHSEDLEFLVQRWSHLTHTFIAAWGEFTPTLEDVYVLLKLPCFGTANILDREIPAAVARMATRLKSAATDSAYYTNTLIKRGSAMSNKQSYAGWVRYFFGIVKFRNKGTEEEEWFLEADLRHNNKDLELSALIAFWLDRYVFPGPSHESISPGVFVFAAMLAQGMRLPLAPMYLGGLYARLDQVQEQLKISNGRYGVKVYADVNFLSLFLFERFKCYAPPRTLPREYIAGDRNYEAPRAWAWLKPKEIGAKAQCSLASVIDKEAYFCFRPYIVDSRVDRHHAGFERRSRIYGFCLTERNDRANLYEGVYDLWRLFCHVGTLVGYAVTDCLRGPGGATFPSLYRPDRVVRQLGWDQMPTTTDMGVAMITEAYSEFLFLDPSEGDVAHTSFVPLREYNPGVSAAWLAYHASLISSMRHAEQNRKKFPSLVGVRTPLSIVYNDPYYSAATSSKGKRVAQEVPSGHSKRRRIMVTEYAAKTTNAKRVGSNISDKASRGQAAPPPSSIPAPSTRTRSGLRLKFMRQVPPPSTSSALDKWAQGSSHTSPSFENAPWEVEISVPPQMIISSTNSAPTKPIPCLSIPALPLIQPPLGGDACAPEEKAPNHSSGPEGHSEVSCVGDSELLLELSPSRVAQSEAHHDDIASKRGLDHPASSEDEEHQEGELHRDIGVREEHVEVGPYDETAANKECRKRSFAEGEACRGGEKHIVPSIDVVDHSVEHSQGATISPPVHPDVEKEMSFLALPTDVVAMVGPFLTSHPDMRLDINRVLRRMAYKCLCKFLLFAGTQPLSALLSNKREDFIKFMDELVDFSFDSTWLDDMRAWVTSPSPAEKVVLKKQRVSVEIARLESEVKALKSEMESFEEQESHLRSLLDAPLLKL